MFFLALKRVSCFIVFTGTLVVPESSYIRIDQPKKKLEGISRWTGTVTFVEIINIASAAYTSKSERHITASFNDALPTMYRDDDATELNFTDDKGTGSHTYHSEGTFIGGSKCVTDCQSSDKAELHAVVINEDANVYDIEVVSPTCIGTTCGNDGGTKEYGPEGRSVIVSNQPLGIRKDILDGTKTVTSELSIGGTATTTTTWHLVRSKPVDVELIVTPVDYDNWLPAPGRDELSKGSVMTINLKLQGKNGNPLKVKVESFELRLNNTSKEPGITINYPVEPDPNQLPDLRFLLLPNIESVDEDQFTSVSSPDGITGKTYIASYDGGGWTTLTAEAILKDGRHIQGRLLVSGGEMDIRIPKRDPNSKIAESWLKKYKNLSETNDKEELKDNAHNGDGFTAYEEYRGVISEGKFKRLDPTKKEVGIEATQTDFALFKEGIGWFKNASDMEIIRFDFDRNEVATDRKINMNAKSAHDFDQYAIYLMDGGLGKDNGTLGVTYCRAALWIPANIIGVVIDWNKIQGAYQRRINEAKPELIKFTLKDYLAQTVAHELGHAVNVDHHGADIKLDNYDAKLKEYVPYTVNEISNQIRIFDRQGNLITQRPYTLFAVGGQSGTVESGDLSCMLNYYPYYSWGYTSGADGAYIYNQERLLPLGKTFCKSKNGTDFNATKLYFGDAATGKGNCWGQIQLRN